MGFISKYKFHIILFVFLNIIVMSLLWKGYLADIEFLTGGYELLLGLPTVFAVFTMYYKNENPIEDSNVEFKKLITIDLIYGGIALLTGLVFLVVALVISF